MSWADMPCLAQVVPNSASAEKISADISSRRTVLLYYDSKTSADISPLRLVRIPNNLPHLDTFCHVRLTFCVLSPHWPGIALPAIMHLQGRQHGLLWPSACYTMGQGQNLTAIEVQNANNYR